MPRVRGRGFEHLPEQHQRGNHRRRLEIDLSACPCWPNASGIVPWNQHDDDAVEWPPPVPIAIN